MVESITVILYFKALVHHADFSQSAVPFSHSSVRVMGLRRVNSSISVVGNYCYGVKCFVFTNFTVNLVACMLLMFSGHMWSTSILYFIECIGMYRCWLQIASCGFSSLTY